MYSFSASGCRSDVHDLRHAQVDGLAELARLGWRQGRTVGFDAGFGAGGRRLPRRGRARSFCVPENRSRSAATSVSSSLEKSSSALPIAPIP